ncbi:hypothetical protein [Adhaeribacter radiodurans]|uniref:Uncharacterized protein n=1 Tax=Adhaeribacter radiodurans TaxID=2745197 RepID=A0A7L7L8D3_9BACT|nr:hypothetical protein [Adhaeribacter radiodurans]QMU29092.1 hypothetical protein HUW48_14030 [Adhaeribacter radiodurans]
MKRVILILIFFILTFSHNSCTECREGFQVEIVTVPRANWFPLVESVLNSTSIRLNNYTPNRNEFDSRQEFAFLKPNDSHITFNGITQVITELENEASIRREPFTIYINDLNSSAVTSATIGPQLVVNVQMESDGTEIITDCIKNIACVEKPTIEVDDAIITLFLKPEVDGTGNLIFKVDTDFSAASRVSICHDNFWAFLCGLFGINEGTVNQGLESRITSFLSSPNIQERINGSVRPLISSLLGPGERLTSINIGNTGDLLITKAVPCMSSSSLQSKFPN